MAVATTEPSGNDPSSTAYAATQPLGVRQVAAPTPAPMPISLSATSISGPIPISTAPQRRDAVILFTELRGLASMSGVLEPGQVLALASEFYGFVAAAVANAGGEAIAVHHDSMLSVFARGSRATRRSAQSARRRLSRAASARSASAGASPAACARRCRRVCTWAKWSSAAQAPRARSAAPRLGDSITVGHHILRRARTGEIVMSDSVMGALSVDNLNMDAEPLPQLEMRGRQPMRIYGVLIEQRLDFT